MARGLHGREELLERLGSALTDAQDGRGRLILLTGEAGIGKTTMARELLRLARERGMRVDWGTCLDGDLSAPFAPWIEVLGPEAAASVAGVFAAPARGMDPQEAEWLRVVAFHEVAEQLRARAERGGLVVVLDDLHWADTPSQLLLRYVAGQLASAPVVLIGCCRDQEVEPTAPLAALLAGVQRVALEGLSSAAVVGLVAELTGEAVDGELADRLLDATGGNPFLLTQVARLSLDRSASLAEMPVPPEAEAILSRRLARLDEQTVRQLRSIAVLGETVEVDIAAEICRVDRRDLLAALERGGHAGVVASRAESGLRWAYVHALLHRVCLEGLPVAERFELHARAASALQRRGAEPTAIVAHLRRAGLPPTDPRLRQAELAAAERAMQRLAWEEAAIHFDRAARGALPGVDGADARAQALLGLGDARLRSGNVDGASVAFERAAVLGRELGRPEVIARAALGFGAGFGGFEVQMLNHRQIALLEEAAEALSVDSPLRPWVLARLSVALSFVGSDQRRLALANGAVSGARAAEDGAALASALAARCDALAGPDHTAARLEAATEVVQLARGAEDGPLELLGRRLRLVALAESGAMDEVDAEIGAFERVAAVIGDPLYRWYVPLWRGMQSLARGDAQAALAHGGRAHELGTQVGSANAVVLAQTLELMVLVERRDPAVEEHFDHLAEQYPDVLGPAGLPMLVWALALTGRRERAVRHLDEVRAHGIDRLARDSEWLPVMTQIAEAAIVLGADDLAAAVRPLLVPYAQRCVVEGIGAAQRGSVARICAQLAVHAGDADAARAMMSLAADIDGGLGALPAAHAMRIESSVLGLVGNRDAASALAEEASERYRALGLPAQAAEVRAAQSPPRVPVEDAVGREHGILRRDGEVWALSWEGRTVRLRHSKGIADVAAMLLRAGEEVHVRELEPDAAPAAGSQVREARLDRRAVAEYRARLTELEEDLAQAEGHADLERAAKLATERDFLVAELGAAFGLGGRARPDASDVDERLRKAVGARVRDALRRLDAVHPAAARHLRHSIRTGLFCSYRPERPTRWSVDEQGA